MYERLRSNKGAREEAKRKWMEFCESYRERTDQRINEIVSGKPIQCATEQEEFMLMIRVHAARRFCGFHVYRKNLQSRSAIPHIETPNPLRYLLVDWWHGVGIDLAFDDGWMREMDELEPGSS